MRDEFDDLLASLAIEPVKKPEIEYQEPLVVKPTNPNNQNVDLNDFNDVLNNISSSNNVSNVSNTNNVSSNNNIVASSDSEAFKEYTELRNASEPDIEVPDLADTMHLEEAPSLIDDSANAANAESVNIFDNQESKSRGYEVPDIKGTTKRVPDIDDSENNVYRLETEYIDIILSYEEELKDLKRRFKLNTLEYQAKGVQTRLVIKAVKQAAKDAKKEGYIIKDENRIQERINNDSNLLGRICTIINSSI